MTRTPGDRLGWLDRLSALLGMMAFVIVVLRYGFPNLHLPTAVYIGWSAILPVGFFIDAVYRLLWVNDPWRYLRLHPTRYLILIIIILELSGLSLWTSQLGQQQTEIGMIAGEIFLVIFLFSYVGSWIQGIIMANRWLANQHIPVLSIPAITFLVSILLGALALSLPGLRFNSRPFIDHLFTSTSALCVTGLTVYDISTELNPIGQTVLALLIQIGGIGTLTTLGMLVLWQSGTLTTGERVAFSELIGGVHLKEMRKLIALIIRITLLVELFGTVSFWLLWQGRVAHPLPMGLFHSISAFCNAGFTLFQDSFASFHDDSPLLFILSFLIVAGGAGFPVVADSLRAIMSYILPWQESKPMSRGSRVVLISSAALIGLGTLCYLLDGWLSGGARSISAAIFQAVTTRTAGFQVESQLNFSLLGLITTMTLMVIGASPQSTGGGVKTTTLVRLFSRVDPRDRFTSSKSFFSFKPFRIALFLIFLYLGTGLLSGIALHFTDNVSYSNAWFETFSALGTVGLSRDVTPLLSVPGKLIDIVLMFTGRVLYPTLVIGIVRKRREGPDPVPWI